MRIDGPQITGSFNLNGDAIADLDALVTTSSFNMMTASMATTASNTFKGTQTYSGSIVPSVNNTYDLGSPTHQFRHVYISTGSLYIDGTKVLGSTSSELQITTDSGQSFKVLETGADTITLQSADGNVTLTSTGGGDIVMDPSTGVIGLKGTVTIYTGNKIVSSDGNSIQFGNGIAITGSIVATNTNLITGSGQISSLGFATTGSNTFNGNLTVTGYIDAQELRTTYISSSILYRSGSTKFGDESSDTHAFTGSLLVSGSISVPGSNLVSGSAQVDVMSTTNVVRLATTGSNTFVGNQVVSGSLTTTGRLSVSGTTLIGEIQSSYALIETTAGYGIWLRPAGVNSPTGAFISTAGNLGLGTVSPVTYGTRNLDVNAGSGGSAYIVARANSNGGTIELAFDTDSGYLSTKSNHPLRIRTNDTTRVTISTGGTATFTSDIITNGTFYTTDSGPSIYQNRINAGWNSVGDGIDLWINYEGYQNGTSNFRDFRVGNGKRGSAILFVDGSEGTTTLSGNLIMSKSVDPKISSDTGIGLNIDGAALYLNRYSMSNISMVPNGGNVIIGSGTTSSSLDISSRTDAITLPRGTTAQRPGTSVAGMGRFNTTTTRTEFFNGNVWVNVGGNADGSTSSSAAASAKAIKQVVGNPTSGVYWLQVPNVNGGNPFQCYCDFTMDGGIGYAIIFNQYFEGAESGPAHASFASSTITTAGFDSEYQVAPTAMVSNYGLTKLAVFARTGGVASGGITGATYYNWAAFTGPTTTQFNNIFTNGYESNQFTGTFNSSDGNTGTAYFPNGHGNTGGVTQITNGNIVNNYIIYEYKQGGGTDPNHFWMVANGRNGDTYWVNNNRYGSGSGNVMYNRWGGVALY
jgi:hypothetical protein